MSRRVVGVTLDNLDSLPKKCRRCVFWELAPHIREQAEEFGQTDLEKEAWVSSVLLTALRVIPEFTGSGLGRLLVQAVAKDLTRRGVRAVEAFGDAQPDEESSCVVPAEFLQQVGFKTVRAHPRWPRLRLELRTALTWKEDVEAALERLLSSVTISSTASSAAPANA